MFGERFGRARSASGLSMKELGDSVGVSANMIKNMNMEKACLPLQCSFVLQKL